MSRLGEMVDRILELLGEGEDLTVHELKERVPLMDTEILKFMAQEGLIELENGEARITEFGKGIIAVK